VGEKVRIFRNCCAHFESFAKVLPPSKLVQYVMTESGMERMYKDDKVEGAERLENIRELGALAARYDELPLEEGIENFWSRQRLRATRTNSKTKQTRCGS
jgi:superfamily I DNA/RNA helicase